MVTNNNNKKLNKVYVLLGLGILFALGTILPASGSFNPPDLKNNGSPVYNFIEFGKPSAPINVNLSILGTPSLNKEVSLTFVVTALRDLSNTTIQISLPDGLVLVNGDLLWKGDIAKDETVEVQAFVKAVKTGDYVINAIARSFQPWYVFGKEDILYVSVSEETATVGKIEPIPQRPPMSKRVGTTSISTEKEISKQVASAGNIITVNGKFNYTDDRSNPQPIKHATVKLFDDDSGIEQELGTTTTDDQGNYQFNPVNNVDEDGTTLDIFVRLYAIGSAANVVDASQDTYTFKTNVSYNVSDGPINIGTTTSPDADDGAYNIYNVVYNGYTPQQVTIMWYPGNTDGTHYHPGGQIHLLGEATDTDEWDEDVMLHEYGHFIMYSVYGEMIPGASGSHQWDQPATGPGQIAVNMAFSEGWATFFQSAVQNDEVYTDTSDGSTVLIEHHLEPQTPTGEDVEGAVAGTLWDIYDPANEATDTLDLGFDEIWDTFKNYETNNHHIYTIHEFFDGWLNRCHNHRVATKSIFNSHGMPDYAYPTPITQICDGLQYLRTTQNPDGSWTGSVGKNVGYTALGVLPFLNYGINESDPTVSKAINYIRSNKKPDGSIYVSWSNYETSLAVLPLVATHNSSYDADITAARNFLVNIQNDETEGLTNLSWQYGGWGYQGNSPGWSDLSNTQWSLMGLDAANLSKTKNTWSKAELYLTRSQNLHATNPDYDVTNDGGFTYQPPKISCCWAGSNSYGAMTAAGVWSLRLTGVETADQRVLAGLNWLRDHYAPIDTVQNPGIGNQYLYYYLLGFAKALIMTGIPSGSWQETASNDITNYIVSEQYDDGHWTSAEGDLFATEQAILALQTRTIPTDIKRLSYLTFILHSNADLHVYDPLGRHVGKNYTTGGIDIQIPNATYTSNAEQNITIPGLEAGNYRIVLIGTGTGEYTLDVKGGVGDTVVSEDSYTANITEGEVHDASVNVAMITWLTIHVTAPELINAIVQSATGTGNVSFVSDAGTVVNLIAVNESDLPAAGKPNIQFPHGFFSFNITGLNPGQTVNVTIAFPSDIPITAQYWKYHTPQGWYQIPVGSNDGDNIITIQLQDSGVGDDDGIANGVIVDAGGPGIILVTLVGNVTGGGWIVSPIKTAQKNNNKATFGFEAYYGDAIKPIGNLSYNDHAAGLKVNGNVTTLSINKAANTSIFSGTAKITNATMTINGTYTVTAVDNGEPGRNDTFAIIIPIISYKANGTLKGGNIQINSP